MEKFLASSALLSNPHINDDAFVHDAAELLSMVNYTHAFREGNGRTGERIEGVRGGRSPEDQNGIWTSLTAGRARPREPGRQISECGSGVISSITRRDKDPPISD